MPGIVRLYDTHIGHSGSNVPFHKTYYAAGSPNVFANGRNVIRKGDRCACGDPAVGCSSTVFANNIPVHRKSDATGGHGPWVPNANETASDNVLVDS